MDQLVIGFTVVLLIAAFIMNKEKNCFTWCDVAKTLLGFAATELVSYFIKGGVSSVRIVGAPFNGGSSGGTNIMSAVY